MQQFNKYHTFKSWNMYCEFLCTNKKYPKDIPKQVPTSRTVVQVLVFAVWKN